MTCTALAPPEAYSGGIAAATAAFAARVITPSPGQKWWYARRTLACPDRPSGHDTRMGNLKMKTFKTAPLSAAVALVVFGAGLGPVAAQPGWQPAHQTVTADTAPMQAASRFVRVPSAGANALNLLELSPRFAADYGSFRWLELSAADYLRMTASGTVFDEDKEAGQVQINRFRFDPLVDGAPPVGSAGESEGAGPGFHLVQFRGPVKADWLSELEAAGLEPMTSCEQGVCGTCLTTVLEGEPDHRDLYLNPAEKESGTLILPCVSRCKGKKLVLDL